MIHSFVFSEGKPVGRDLEVEALRLVRADKGLMLWIDLAEPTEEEIKSSSKACFNFTHLRSRTASRRVLSQKSRITTTIFSW